MSLLTSKVIKDYASELADSFKIDDKERVHRIIKSTAIFHDKREIPHTVESDFLDEFSGGLWFSPALEYALMDGLPLKDALNLFESTNVYILAFREFFCGWLKKDLPLYTLHEFKILLIEFKEYLLENYFYLLETGFTKKRFSKSPWFEHNFGYNYFTKLPYSLFSGFDSNLSRETINKLSSRDGNKEIIYNHTWSNISPNDESTVWSDGLNLKKDDGTLIKLLPYNYQDAALIKGLPINIAEQLPKCREKLLKLKIAIIDIFINNWEEKNSEKMYEECLNLILEKLSKKEVKLLFRADRYLYKKLKIQTNFYFLYNLFFDFWELSKGYFWGSFKGLLYLIGFILEELNIGMYHKTKSKIMKLPKTLYFNNVRSYYEAIISSAAPPINEIIDQYGYLYGLEVEFWKNYWQKINRYLKKNLDDEISINVKVKPKYAKKLKIIVENFAKYQASHLKETGNIASERIVFSGQDQPQYIPEKHNNDYVQYEYKCRDKVHIPGTSSIYRSNEIIVNGIKIKIGDSLFSLLLRFIVELKKKEGGWVDRNILYKDRVIRDPDKYQIYSRLRTTLQGSLIDKDGEKFIENDGLKSYRISTHPDFITYDKEKLLRHPISKKKKSEDIDKIDLVEIKEVAKDLPDN